MKFRNFIRRVVKRKLEGMKSTAKDILLPGFLMPDVAAVASHSCTRSLQAATISIFTYAVTTANVIRYYCAHNHNSKKIVSLQPQQKRNIYVRRNFFQKITGGAVMRFAIIIHFFKERNYGSSSKCYLRTSQQRCIIR